ncbi:hypothetical protein BKA62DRAFT_709729 [Auriculariales sp. MPI-PUGE-AT-0066]|nr:hypothetical protein BKA62DRAFT_709729 [Auriculariales sp. MPI-PUGE-AT-0066]
MLDFRERQGLVTVIHVMLQAFLERQPDALPEEIGRCLDEIGETVEDVLRGASRGAQLGRDEASWLRKSTTTQALENNSGSGPGAQFAAANAFSSTQSEAPANQLLAPVLATTTRSERADSPVTTTSSGDVLEDCICGPVAATTINYVLGDAYIQSITDRAASNQSHYPATRSNRLNTTTKLNNGRFPNAVVCELHMHYGRSMTTAPVRRRAMLSLALVCRQWFHISRRHAWSILDGLSMHEERTWRRCWRCRRRR